MPHLSKKQHQILETKHRLSKALYLLVTERHYDKILSITFWKKLASHGEPFTDTLIVSLT